jgi:ABC-type amino acid transport substrate-binding protein
MFTRKGVTSIPSVEALEGKTVIVMNRDAAYDYLVSSHLVDTDHMILVESLPDGLRLLASGKGDAAVMSKLVGLLIGRRLQLTNLGDSPTLIGAYRRPFSIALQHGDLATLELLTQGLNILQETGQHRELYTK